MPVVGVDPIRRKDDPPDGEQRCRPEGKECIPEGAAALCLLLRGKGAAVCFDDEIDEPREQKGAGGAICTPRQGGRKNQTGVESGRKGVGKDEAERRRAEEKGASLHTENIAAQLRRAFFLSAAEGEEADAPAPDADGQHRREEKERSEPEAEIAAVCPDAEYEGEEDARRR